MSLFDDLLTKVQPSLSGSNSSHTNEPITISDSTPIITSQDVHMTEMPNPVAIETSNTSGTINDVLVNASVAPTVAIDTTPIESPIIGTTEAISPLITIDSTPVESPILETAQEDELVLPENNTTAFIEETYSPLTDIPESIILADEVVESSPLFDMGNDDSTSLGDTLIENTKPETVTPEKTATSGSFRDTAEYIGHALEEVTVLISSIDRANQDKIAERESYRMQKEHFAELELQAEGEHQKMLIERAHAKKMETYFKHEQARSEAPMIIKPEVTKKSAHVIHAKAKATKTPTQSANDSLFALAA